MPFCHARLRQLALSQPQMPCVVTPQGVRTSAQFHTDVLSAAAHLHRAGLAPGQFVALCHPDFAAHLALVLACEHLGLVSLSLPMSELKALNLPPYLAMTVAVDASPSPAGTHTGQVLVWNPSHHGASAPHDAPPAFVWDKNALCRLAASSGTAGTAKLLGFEWAQQQAKLRFHGHLTRESTRGAAIHSTLSLAVNSTYLLARHALSAGITLVHGPLDWALQTQRLAYLETLPLMLDAYFRQMPQACNPHSPDLRIKVIGAALSQQLVRQCRDMLGVSVSARYATNEVWPLGLAVDERGHTQLADGVQAQILDEHNVPCDFDATGWSPWGQLAVRSPTMIGGYLHPAQANEARFQNGWFLTADWCRLHRDGGLEILGRCDDMLNRSGLKFSPEPLEAQLLTLPGVREAAVTSFHDAQQGQVLGVALVLAPEQSREGILPDLELLLGQAGWKFASVQVLSGLPRTANFKLQRMALRQLFQSA